FDDTTEMQIDISVDQPNNYIKSLERWPQVRPSYVPEWLPPFPTIISHKEDHEKGDEHEANDKKPEPAVDNAESVIVENITGINSEMKGASANSLVNTPHDRNVKTSRRIKRSPDQRPPTYDQFTNIYKSITSNKQTMKDLETETTKDEKKKKRKLKVSTLSLFPSHHAFETKFDGCDGIISPETPNSLPFFKDIPRKIPIFAYPPPKPSKSVESKVPSQTVSASSDSKLEEKFSASRKGKEKEKMIIFTPDNFEAPTPQPLPSKSQTPVQRDTKSKTKKAYTPVSSEKPIQKPRKGSQAGTTVLKLRVGTSTASAISSTPSVQTELVVNNDTADPPEIINCICPYPLSEIDDGNFMLSCDNCQVWFHGICTGFGPTPVEVNTWYCERCIEK
ncbi:7372_t:CDS:1, partial [Acaulospora morrowiae]